MTPLSQTPAYVAAIQKQHEISSALCQTVQRIEDIERDLAGRSAATDSLAATDRILANHAEPGRSAQLDSLHAQHLALRERREILTEGARLQSREVDRVVASLSRAAADELAGDHRALAALAAAKLREFDAVQAEERVLLARLARMGYDWPSSLDRVFWPLMGTLETLPVESLLSVQIKVLETYAGTTQRPPPPAGKRAAI